MSRKEEEIERKVKERKGKESGLKFSIVNLRLFISIIVIELERAYGSHDANQICSHLPFIQGNSYWVQAPLAHLRSASEVATDPAAITLH